MKKIISNILLTAILVLPLSGCGPANSQEEPADSGGALDATAVLELGGQDNSLDAYSAAVNTPLQMEHPADAIDGGGERIILGASRAYCFKKHLFENVDECWDELSFVTIDGRTGSERFDRENQVWDVGPVAGTDLNIELDRKTLLDIIGKARPTQYFPTEFRGILFEELEQYFSGEITEDKLIDNLESCLGLYLEERN